MPRLPNKVSYPKLCSFLRGCLAFLGGVFLAQAYYYFLLKQISFPYHIGTAISIFLSAILGAGSVWSPQLRCVCALSLPQCCGKPGRGVLKAIVLTYIIAGPITNMGMNAREVVRVFACTTRLSHNLTKEKYRLVLAPVTNTALGLGTEFQQLKKAFRTIDDVIEPMQLELESEEEVERHSFENAFVDDLFGYPHRSQEIELMLDEANTTSTPDYYEMLYKRKLLYRCENQLSQATVTCVEQFTEAYNLCSDVVPRGLRLVVCWPLMVTEMCDLIGDMKRNYSQLCGDGYRIPQNMGVAYVAIKNVKREFCEMVNDVHLQYKVNREKKIYEVQDAKETAKRVLHAFEEKEILMHYVLTAMNICMALVFLRIFSASVSYHDLYLTNIDYDNIYVTSYFKTLDFRRKAKGKYTLLPLKKMERNRYIDAHSLSTLSSQREQLAAQVLKVLLEVVTATTFVMLDRLFYEALDVVRQHAAATHGQQGTRDLEVMVEGTGISASMIRKLINGILSRDRRRHQIVDSACQPRPHLMPYYFFVKIYGGYLWILLLLFINPYTLRLRRSICSYFYPRREKQRILHLYNDILKKRMKMQKTLRRKAVCGVRAHYVSGQSLARWRARWPALLGWLRLLPAARPACLLCGEHRPTDGQLERWYSCVTAQCPFVYCAECWREAGARCLACVPSLADLSDAGELSDHLLYP